jgi:oxygen-independent coproporphyrinogen-3 oxidase
MSSPFATPRAAYVHVPFCRHRCGYCNFTVVAGRDDLIEAYLTALELELSGLHEPHEVDTLFFGGGTPTHLPPVMLERLLKLALHWFPLSAGHEFSVEANPADLDAAKVDLLAAYGVNRISLGAQSFNAERLQLLERDHRDGDIERSLRLAREKIRSVSLDLIFGVPGETLDQWAADLAAGLRLEPQHVSTYGLTFEWGTTFWGRLQRGELPRLGEELERDMYGHAIDRLTATGYEHYEVSNFGLPGHRCRHNETYWSGAGYYAVGPGASRYVEGRRETNHRSTTTWIKRVLAGESPVAESETLSPEDRAREALVLGLRRLEGVDREKFAQRTGYKIESLVGPELRRFVELGFLRDASGRVQLTREGLFVSDSLWPEFLRA